jgi:hypothetical protein
VQTLQHAPELGPHTIWAHVEPSVNTSGATHALGPDTIEQKPVAGSQHAPPPG